MDSCPFVCPPFPSVFGGAESLLSSYASLRGRAYPDPAWRFYTAFLFFKNAGTLFFSISYTQDIVDSTGLLQQLGSLRVRTSFYMNKCFRSCTATARLTVFDTRVYVCLCVSGAAWRGGASEAGRGVIRPRRQAQGTPPTNKGSTTAHHITSHNVHSTAPHLAVVMRHACAPLADGSPLALSLVFHFVDPYVPPVWCVYRIWARR